MNVKEAEQIVYEFDEITTPNESDEFNFIEAMSYLIRELKRPKDIMYLGGYYYEKRHFDLALKYYEMAAAMDYDPAYECLGFIWYYGRTGEKDYKKAFEYFSRMMEKGNLVATYKIADMYKNGYYVAKDMEKYVSMIEELYSKVSKCTDVFDPLPEVYTRLAAIRLDQGEIEEAVFLYLGAKDFLAQRIQYNAFFGNLNIMKWLIEDLYKISDFDKYDFDLYDMYYALMKPVKIRFFYGRKMFEVRSELDGAECNICFDGKWFRNRDEFFQKATIDGERITSLYYELEDFEVREEG